MSERLPRKIVMTTSYALVGALSLGACAGTSGNKPLPVRSSPQAETPHPAVSPSQTCTEQESGWGRVPDIILPALNVDKLTARLGVTPTEISQAYMGEVVCPTGITMAEMKAYAPAALIHIAGYMANCEAIGVNPGADVKSAGPTPAVTSPKPATDPNAKLTVPYTHLEVLCPTAPDGSADPGQSV